MRFVGAIMGTRGEKREGGRGRDEEGGKIKEHTIKLADLIKAAVFHMQWSHFHPPALPVMKVARVRGPSPPSVTAYKTTM